MSKKKIVLKKKALKFIEEEFKIENPSQYGIFLDHQGDLVIEGTGKPRPKTDEIETENDEDEIIVTTRSIKLNKEQREKIKSNIIKTAFKGR